MSKRPNKAPEPTSTLGTSAAELPRVPSVLVVIFDVGRDLIAEHAGEKKEQHAGVAAEADEHRGRRGARLLCPADEDSEHIEKQRSDERARRSSCIEVPAAIRWHAAPRSGPASEATWCSACGAGIPRPKRSHAFLGRCDRPSSHPERAQQGARANAHSRHAACYR
jgi:hypothetical protein